MNAPNKLPPLPDSLEKLIAEMRLYSGDTIEGSRLERLSASWAGRLEAIRQSQSLPAGAVAGLVGKWRDSSAFETDGYSILHRCASDLEQALQADAREKGEVDKQEKSE